MLNEILTNMTPAITLAITTIGLAALGFVTARLNEKFKVEIEQGKKIIEGLDREVLHKALSTAAEVAVDRGLIGAAAIDFMLKYVVKSSPDAVKALNPSTQVLSQIAESKLAERAREAVVSSASTDVLLTHLKKEANWALSR